MKLEQTILKELFTNEEYSRKVLPYIKSDYFHDAREKLIFDEYQAFMLKYNVLPKFDSIEIEIDSSTRLNDTQIKDTKQYLGILKQQGDEQDKSNFDWLIDTTEKFCKDKALYNAMTKSVEIMQKKEQTGIIPQLLTEALAISFDPYVGHDYLADSDVRYDSYHRPMARIPFDIEILNKVTKGGLPNKTFTVIMGGINVGKTLTMCHMAAANLHAGHDVLYITLEMSEEEISKRIDCNLLNMDMDTLMEIPKETYQDKIAKLKAKTTGKLIIKEYPTAAASAFTFKSLLNELYLKKTFKPKIVYVDYINICTSSRIRMGGAVNTYSLIKSIAEELRGLAVEYNLPIVTATQVTRSGYQSTDPDMTDTAESFGLPATADFMIALVATDEMRKLNQMAIIQLKSRLGDKSKDRRFIVGVELSKFRLYDVEDSATEELIDTPAPKKSFESKGKFDKSKLEGVKF